MNTPIMRTPRDFHVELQRAVELLTEAREASAACFRVIAATEDKTITHRLETELRNAGVKEGFGVRMQNFLAEMKKEG